MSDLVGQATDEFRSLYDHICVRSTSRKGEEWRSVEEGLSN